MRRFNGRGVRNRQFLRITTLTVLAIFLATAELQSAKASTLQDEERVRLNETERSDLEVKQSQLILLSVNSRNVERVLRAEKRFYARVREAETKNSIRPKARETAIAKIRLHHDAVLKRILGESVFSAYRQAVQERASRERVADVSRIHGPRTRSEGAPPEMLDQARRTPAAYQASTEGSDGW